MGASSGILLQNARACSPQSGCWGLAKLNYYLPSVVAGASAGAVVLVDDPGAEVVAGSSALLQPANNTNVIKLVAISALFFIIGSLFKILFRVFTQ
jgi:hypothetical protein